MKIISIILSFLVLLLSMMPCSDKAAVPSAQRTQVEIAKETHHHKVPAADDCSPFCHCACCAVFAIVAPGAMPGVRPMQPAKVFNAAYTSLIREFPRSIWQPPQLS